MGLNVDSPHLTRNVLKSDMPRMSKKAMDKLDAWPHSKNVLHICGPTACGKLSLAVDICELKCMKPVVLHALQERTSAVFEKLAEELRSVCLSTNERKCLVLFDATYTVWKLCDSHVVCKQLPVLVVHDGMHCFHHKNITTLTNPCPSLTSLSKVILASTKCRPHRALQLAKRCRGDSRHAIETLKFYGPCADLEKVQYEREPVDFKFDVSDCASVCAWSAFADAAFLPHSRPCDTFDSLRAEINEQLLILAKRCALQSKH